MRKCLAAYPLATRQALWPVVRRCALSLNACLMCGVHRIVPPLPPPAKCILVLERCERPHGAAACGVCKRRPGSWVHAGEIPILLAGHHLRCIWSAQFGGGGDRMFLQPELHTQLLNA
jgi:hypothetical protein